MKALARLLPLSVLSLLTLSCGESLYGRTVSGLSYGVSSDLEIAGYTRSDYQVSLCGIDCSHGTFHKEENDLVLLTSGGAADTAKRQSLDHTPAEIELALGPVKLSVNGSHWWAVSLRDNAGDGTPDVREHMVLARDGRTTTIDRPVCSAAVVARDDSSAVAVITSPDGSTSLLTLSPDFSVASEKPIAALAHQPNCDWSGQIFIDARGDTVAIVAYDSLFVGGLDGTGTVVATPEFSLPVAVHADPNGSAKVLGSGSSRFSVFDGKSEVLVTPEIQHGGGAFDASGKAAVISCDDREIALYVENGTAFDRTSLSPPHEGVSTECSAAHVGADILAVWTVSTGNDDNFVHLERRRWSAGAITKLPSIDLTPGRLSDSK